MKNLLILLFVLVCVISTSSVVLASSNLTNVAIAYDAYNGIWAYAGVKNNKIYVQMYNNYTAERRDFIAETCISRMRHTPGRPGTEDYIFRMTANSYLFSRGIFDLVPGSTDMTNPNIGYSYIFPDIKIVYSSNKRSFLVTWVQKSRLGEQLVCQVFRFDRQSRQFATFDEPRVLNRVDFIYEDGRWKPDNNYLILRTDIDVSSDFEYAIVSTVVAPIGYGYNYPVVRLVPMGVFEGENQYHYTLDRRYLTTYIDQDEQSSHDLISVSGTIYKDRQTRRMKIFIMHAFSKEMLTDSVNDKLIIYKIDRNFDTAWRTRPYKEILLIPNRGYSEIVRGEPALIRVNPANQKPIISYVSFITNGDADVYSLKVMNENQLIFTSVTRYQPHNTPIQPIEISWEFDYKMQMSSNGCILTYQNRYTLFLGNHLTDDFSFIFGKYITFTGTNNYRVFDFAMFQNGPDLRFNKGIVYLPHGSALSYWESLDSHSLNFSASPLPSRDWEYRPNIKVSISSGDRLDFSWDAFTARNNQEHPFYELYIITPYSQIYTLRGLDTQESLYTNYDEVAVILLVKNLLSPIDIIPFIKIIDVKTLRMFSLVNSFRNFRNIPEFMYNPNSGSGNNSNPGGNNGSGNNPGNGSNNGPNNNGITIPTNTLQGYWKLDELIDPRGDSSGNNNTLTQTGSVVVEPGRLGNCVSMSGEPRSYNFLYNSAPAGLNGGIPAQTISVWIKTTAGGGASIIGKWSNANSGGYLVTLGGGSVIYYYGWQASIRSNRTVNDGSWHQIVATADGSTVRLYIDGTEDNSQPQAGNIGNNGSDPIIIGQNANYDEQFNGSIDEVAIWNRALSNEEVIQMYQMYSSN